MPTRLEDKHLDTDRLINLISATIDAMLVGKCTAAEMQIVATILFVGISKRLNMSSRSAGRMLKLNWDQPLTDEIKDLLHDAPLAN